MLDEAQLQDLHRAYRKAYGCGLALCVAWPLVLATLVIGGLVKPGHNPPAGVFQQLGYTFTGLVFLMAAYVTWRSGKVRRGFRDQAPAARPSLLFREVLLYSALFELSCLFGLLYWMLVGQDASRHVSSFMALSPMMFFFFVPRFDAWRAAAEGGE